MAALRTGTVAALDGLALAGEAAFERDCLSFMLEDWPFRTTSADLFAQADDLIARVDGADLSAVRSIVGRLVDEELRS